MNERYTIRNFCTLLNGQIARIKKVYGKWAEFECNIWFAGPGKTGGEYRMVSGFAELRCLEAIV